MLAAGARTTLGPKSNPNHPTTPPAVKNLILAISFEMAVSRLYLTLFKNFWCELMPIKVKS
jgi:hypothetical protein